MTPRPSGIGPSGEGASRREETCRRPRFQAGRRLRLADGQEWYLPGPPSRAFPRTWYGPGYDELLRALDEAEDRPDYLRTELALTILLLLLNYDLRPDELEAILCFAPDDPAQGDSSRELHEVVREHREARPAPEKAARSVPEFSIFQRLVGRLLHWSRAD